MSRRGRAQHSRETRGKFGSGGGSYVVQIPGLTSDDWFKVNAKQKNEIDIVEFRITQDWYPNMNTRGGGKCGDKGMDLKPGELDYKFEIPVHTRVGPGNTNHVCPFDLFGNPCPMCEEKFAKLEANNNKWDKDTMGPLNTSWRIYYNLWNYTTNRFEPWECAYTSFEKMLQDALDNQPDEMYPWAWDIGHTIEFYAREKEIGGGKTWNEPQVPPKFFGREPYPESVVDEVWGFDQFVKFSDYDEIAVAHLGMGEVSTSATDHGDQTPDDIPAQGRRRRTTSETPKEEPRSRRRTQSEPSTRRRERSQPADDNPCPEGHSFGHDCNKQDGCKTCADEYFEKCAALQDDILEGKTKEPEKEQSPRRRRRGN